MTASIWIGGILAGISYGWVTDKIGRRPALFWAAVITLIAVVIQSASQNIGMFVFARVLVGYGTTASGLTGPAYLAETLPLHHRAWGLGLFNDFYYVGMSRFILSPLFSFARHCFIFFSFCLSVKATIQNSTR